MAQGLDFDLKQAVLISGTFGPREIEQVLDAIAVDYTQLGILREAVQELEAKETPTPASNVVLGVCLYLLGNYPAALSALQRGDGGALAHFYIAKANFGLGNYQATLDSYESAAKAGYDRSICALGRVEALRYARDPEGALRELDQRGATVAVLGGNPAEVVALYERAVEADRKHAGALFGLALENDRHGNDETALELYKQSAARFPTHVGALLNLGLMYEDRGQFERAVQCYRRVLDVFPDHERAKLFLKDAQASGDMFYDEDAQKKRDRVSQVLSLPVTDFELSVRSRNCLQKMGIMTLGDLCRSTEQELLASKNFGETSLIEIREMLASKGLHLGQMATDRHVAETLDTESLSADEQALLTRPISDLSLSVRARKCMVRLGITTIGELLRRTGDELLECKNFGVTSLNEVRDKLSSQGLKLRGD